MSLALTLTELAKVLGLLGAERRVLTRSDRLGVER